MCVCVCVCVCASVCTMETSNTIMTVNCLHTPLATHLRFFCKMNNKEM